METYFDPQVGGVQEETYFLIMASLQLATTLNNILINLRIE